MSTFLVQFRTWECIRSGVLERKKKKPVEYGDGSGGEEEVWGIKGKSQVKQKLLRFTLTNLPFEFANCKNTWMSIILLERNQYYLIMDKYGESCNMVPV